MLLLDSSVCDLFKWRQFEPEVILLAVGWYLRFSLSYCDAEELLAERGVLVDHVTVSRWVQRYAPGMTFAPTMKWRDRPLVGQRDAMVIVEMEREYPALELFLKGDSQVLAFVSG